MIRRDAGNQAANRFRYLSYEYEYAMIDGLIEAARERNMHLIIVWFRTKTF